MTTTEIPTTIPTTGQLVGYVRVSTEHQTYDAQHDALTALGVDPRNIFSDKASGGKDDRVGYLRMLDYVRPGDTIVVTALDRLGRSLSTIVNTLVDLGKRGIYVRTLRESIDTSTSVGRMLAGIFASLAEYEKELIAERAAVARQAAADRGKHTGRPRKLDDKAVRMLLAAHKDGESVADLVAQFKISRASVYSILRNAAVTS